MLCLDCPRRPTIPKVPWILAVPPLSTLSGDTFTRGIGEYYQQPSAVGNDSNSIYGEFGMLLICPKHFSTRLSGAQPRLVVTTTQKSGILQSWTFRWATTSTLTLVSTDSSFINYNLKRPHAPVKLMLTPWLRVFYLPSIFEPSCLVLMGRRATMRNPQ